MNLIKLRTLGLDYEDGLHRFMNNEELYCKFLNQFAYNLDTEKLKAVLEDKQYKEAFFFAHSLKGIIGNLSLKILFTDICKVVEDLRHEVKIELKHDFEVYYAHYLKVVEALKEDC